MTLQGLRNLAREICKWQHIQFAIQEIDDVSGLSLLPAQQEFQAISTFIPLDVSVDTEQAIFAFTHPQGMKIAHRIDQWKFVETLLPMHKLHKMKTRFKFRL